MTEPLGLCTCRDPLSRLGVEGTFGGSGKGSHLGEGCDRLLCLPITDISRIHSFCSSEFHLLSFPFLPRSAGDKCTPHSPETAFASPHHFLGAVGRELSSFPFQHCRSV